MAANLVQQGTNINQGLFGHPLGPLAAIGTQIANWISGPRGGSNTSAIDAQAAAAYAASQGKPKEVNNDSSAMLIIVYGLGALIVIALLVWLVRVAVKG